MKKSSIIICLLLSCLCLLQTGCTTQPAGTTQPDSETQPAGTTRPDSDSQSAQSNKEKTASEAAPAKTEESCDFQTMKVTNTPQLSYATQFQIEEYGPYTLVSIRDGGRFFIVPQGEAVPKGLPVEFTVLCQPITNTYLMATAAMDLIGAIDAIDDIRLSGTKEEDWFVESAKQAMENGKMLYAGKYSAPDYELILSNDCSLTIANTMIYHNPQAKEKLEALGIPVLVERSSYEEHPLGRLEWIKVYGALYGKEQEADEFYNESLKRIEPIMEKSKTDKTVAFFYVNANGAINVRKPADYVSKMITLSGGNYVPDKVTTEENAMSTMNMQMEDFYIEAKDADILIYNATIGGEIRSIGELIAKNPLFADFAAVRNKQVYCTTQQMFQQSTHVAGMMEDFHKIIQNEPENLIYLTHVE